MANSVDESCLVWNLEVEDEDIGVLGDASHLNLNRDTALKMKSNLIYNISDRQPHEAISVPFDSERQFFRLVMPSLDLWLSEHNTENPLGVKVHNDNICNYNKFVN